MTGKPLAIMMAVLFSISLVLPSCVSDREIYRSAAGEGELPEWRLLARARENHGPYLQWKKDLIRELLSGSSVANTRLGPVEYAVHGESGPYLVVMHGAPGGYDQTAALFSDMFGKGFRIVSWSRPGYLRTPLLGARTFSEQADVAAALMDELGIHKAAVLGYSAGGPVAIHFAAQYPDRTWALILECAVTRTWVISPENLRERIFYGHLMYSDPFLWTSDVLGQLAPRLIGMSTIEMESSLGRGEAHTLMDNIMKDPRRVDVLTKLTRSMSPGELRRDGMENDVEQLGTVNDLPLGAIGAPTLIIHGTSDADVKVADAELAAREIPSAELFLVPGGFHVLALSDMIDKITDRRCMFLQGHLPRQQIRSGSTGNHL